MNQIQQTRCSGFIFLELIMVMTVLGGLASMAIPQYATYTRKAEAKSCLSNRRNIEMEERTYYIEKNAPDLTISGIYTCPSGGVYVWLIPDPQNDDYPQAACSIHYTGDALPAPTSATTSAPATTTSAPATTTSAPTTTASPLSSTTVTPTTTTTTTIARREVDLPVCQWQIIQSGR